MDNRKFHTAKKDHVCRWCGEKIKKGEKYYRIKDSFSWRYDEKEHTSCPIEQLTASAD